MSGNEVIEQPDVPENPDKKEAPKKSAFKPGDFGYKKFEAKEHKAALLKAKSGEDKEGEEATRRLEAELEAAGGGDKKTLKPQELKTLDESVKLKDEDKKAPKDVMAQKERLAFAKLVRTLTENNKLPVDAYQEAHIFEFKGLTKDGKEVKSEEVQKLLEHVDQGGEIPPNIEFQFHTSFKKGRDENEVVDVNYRLNLHQIMRSGLETTLSSLLSLSYAAAENYDEKKGKTKEGSIEVVKPKIEKGGENPLENLKKQLNQKNFQTSGIQTAQWSALEVSIPEKQKQLSIVFDGEIFQVTEKRLDKSVELPIKSPSEIIQYIENESK